MATGTNRMRPGHHVEVHVVVDGLPIDLRWDPRKGADCLQRRAEHEHPGRDAVGERAGAHAINRQQRLAGAAVQYGECESARETSEYARAAPGVALRKRTGDAMEPDYLPEAGIGQTRTTPDGDKAFTVGVDIDPARRRRRRDGAEAIRDAAHAAAIESGERRGHRGGNARVDRAGAFAVKPAGQSTHSTSRFRIFGRLLSGHLIPRSPPVAGG